MSFVMLTNLKIERIMANSVKPRHHVVITGTGRSGTTFLMQLLTRLNLDTGFDPDDLVNQIDPHSHAGLEWDIRSANPPYIIKTPSFCDYAEEVIKDPFITLDHVFIPVRDLSSAAASRIRVVREHPPTELAPTQMAGGLWGTDNPEDQAKILQDYLMSLLLALADSQIPVTLLRFPRLIKDVEYTYQKLKPLLKGVAFEVFREAFDAVVRPDLVHDFSPSL
jgi:hypothetical protein